MTCNNFYEALRFLGRNAKLGRLTLWKANGVGSVLRGRHGTHFCTNLGVGGYS